ncbi:ubiquitin-like protein ISG15 [Clinocottus analis]|uniref:ubiquitin-like protein ISG15 n=1 Tax=Clinocottus analis TaxID=304258 RepID=UPI0035BF8AB1
MEINIIMLDGTSRPLSVHPDDTVGSLKMKIQQQLGVPSKTQKLIFTNGSSTHLSNDLQTISHYGLHPGATVSLLVTQPAPMQVFLTNEKGQTTTYDIKPDETVGHFKSRVQSREGVPTSQQRLIHQSREMTEDHCKLSDYNVKAMSTINLNLRLRGG